MVTHADYRAAAALLWGPAGDFAAAEFARLNREHFAGSVPALLGREVAAAPVRPRRVPNPARQADPSAPKTIVVRRAADGAMTQAELARWPTTARPAGYYEGGERLQVPTY